jgi:predicted DCC family thiol-disulfide oxidoreductase YuxK
VDGTVGESQAGIIILREAAVEHMRMNETTKPAFQILIDGQCPLCVREGRFMSRLDGGRGRLAIVDIAAPGFDPRSVGKSMDDVMGAIHGVRADGTVIVGMEVFREAYAAVGWGWLVRWTGWPGVRSLVDIGYRWFARHRLRISGWFGHPNAGACENGTCRVR